MAEITERNILEKVQEIKATLADGFQAKDVGTVIRVVCEFVAVAQMPEGEMKALAVKIIDRVIDETDCPWLPDNWVDPLMKGFVPGLIDVVFDAVLGKLTKPA